MTPEEIGDAIRAGWDMPNGPIRVAKAEQLAEFATQSGDRSVLTWALWYLIESYEYGGEGDKILVPFARWLKMWDDNPADFDRETTHALFWVFKWVTGGMIGHANVPLATIRQWLDEMGRRYAEHGHGLRAVHSVRHDVEWHVGDLTAAQAAFDQWIATDRDDMADCHACEAGGQGDWYEANGDLQAALDAWAPVLEGRLRCAHEPHRILSKSLAPLVRLGRLDQARDNHLRGYRMARGNVSLRATVGRHITFAALTGNEARALEMLAEHSDWLRPTGEEVLGRLSFLTPTVILLRRLQVLGRGDLPLAERGLGTTTVDELLPRLEQEIFEITARYDERNGTTAVSDRQRTSLALQPLVDALPLGTRAKALPTSMPIKAPTTTPPPPAPTDLVAEARRLDRAHHPHARRAWERVAAAGLGEQPWTRARIADLRILDEVDDGRDPLDAAAEMRRVADEYDQAGDHERATTARAFAALVGEADDLEWLEILAVASSAAAWDYRARALLKALPDGSQAEDAAFEPVLRALRRMDELSQDDRERAASALVRADAYLAVGQRDEAARLAQVAADGFLAAGEPWQASYAFASLAGLSLVARDFAAAEEHARAGLRHGTGLLGPRIAGELALRLAQACAGQPDRDKDAVDNALLAASRFDECDEARAARARVIAASILLRTGRSAEAVAILETAWPALGPEESVRARQLLGEALEKAGEPRQAAEVYLRAAAEAAAWPDQTDHASLAHDAAGALEADGRWDEARQAYQRARELWLAVGRVHSHVRATRALAWVHTKTDPADWPTAESLLDEAQRVTAAALIEAANDEIRFEHAETALQRAQLMVRWAERTMRNRAEVVVRARALTQEAIDGFDALGSEGARRRAEAFFNHLAGWAGLGH